MPRLLVQTPEGISQEFQLKPQVTTIGRSPRNDICIAEASVSRHHAAGVTRAKEKQKAKNEPSVLAFPGEGK
ncbi:MAG: FHA domain-containing protein [Thermoanaerobaculaceae bacterium]